VDDKFVLFLAVSSSHVQCSHPVDLAEEELQMKAISKKNIFPEAI